MTSIRLVQSLNTIDGPQIFSITAMIYRNHNPNQFITICNDGFIKIWDCQTLNLLKSERIKSGYLMSIISFQQGYLVGIANGSIVKYNQNLMLQWSKMIHEDCVTGIVECQKYLVTTSFDGKVCFLDKNKIDIIKIIDLQIPFYRMCQINGSLYISGNPSFKIDVQNFEITQLDRTDAILLFKNKLIGCSDEFGLQFIEKKPKQHNYSFNVMVNYKDKKIVAGCQKIIALADIQKIEGDNEEYQFSYKIFKADCLQQGFTIHAGILHGDNIILAGQAGYIYKFKVQ